MEKLQALSLFTGAGGLDIGLERAGFDTIGCIEMDTICRETLARNRPDWNLISPFDVVEAAEILEPADLGVRAGELAIIAGGPPCQPFSAASQWTKNGRRGMLDPRANTVAAMFRLVDKFLPKAILIENVAGFLEGKNSAFEAISGALYEINQRHGTNYTLNYSIFNAADFGVPQNRRRAIGVALRSGDSFSFPQYTHKDRHITTWDALWNVQPGPIPVPRGSWTPLLASIPEGKNYQYLTSQGGGPEIFGYRTKYWSFLLKLSKNKPSWTLPASPGPSTGPFHWDNRPLTIREIMRLQSFPDDWEFAGAERSVVKQLGNATPPLLAEVMGIAIARNIAVVNDAVTPSLILPPAPVPPPPSGPLHDIPDSFAHLIGPKEAHPGVGMGPASIAHPLSAVPTAH